MHCRIKPHLESGGGVPPPRRPHTRQACGLGADPARRGGYVERPGQLDIGKVRVAIGCTHHAVDPSSASVACDPCDSRRLVTK